MTQAWPLSLAACVAGLISFLSPCVLPLREVRRFRRCTTAGVGSVALALVIAGSSVAIATNTGTGSAGAVSTRAAPDFVLTSLNGRPVSLSDFRGKIIALNFWATWCAPCKVEMPSLVEFDQRYQSQGLQIVGVSVDDGGAKQIEAFVNDRHVRYPILLGNAGIADAYGGVRFLPQTMIIARDGRIIKQLFGITQKRDLEHEMQQALGVSAHG